MTHLYIVVVGLGLSTQPCVQGTVYLSCREHIAKKLPYFRVKPGKKHQDLTTTIGVAPKTQETANIHPVDTDTHHSNSTHNTRYLPIRHPALPTPTVRPTPSTPKNQPVCNTTLPSHPAPSHSPVPHNYRDLRPEIEGSNTHRGKP